MTPAVKEPVGLTRDDGKRPDGVTLLSWARGKPVCHSSRYSDSYADSHLADTATIAGAAAHKAANTKETKYRQLANCHMSIPVTIETADMWNHLAIKLIQELNQRISAITQDTREKLVSCFTAVRGFTTGKCGLLPQQFSTWNKRHCGYIY